MVTTRRQSGDSMPPKRKLNDDTIVVATKMPKTAQGGKLSAQRLRKATPKRRQAISRAPQIGNHILFVFIGPQRELVTVHSDLLPDPVKAYIHERNVGRPLYQLPDDDVTLFQIYRLYLYSGRICSIGEADQLRPDNGRAQAHADAEWTRLAHCYIFAVAVGDEKFANACIDAIIEKMAEIDRYPTGIASEVYQFTTAGDKLRKLLVDVHVWKGLGKWVKRPHDDAGGPMEFLQDVIQGLATAGEKLYDPDWEIPWEVTTCGYHTHRTTTRC